MRMNKSDRMCCAIHVFTCRVQPEWRPVPFSHRNEWLIILEQKLNVLFLIHSYWSGKQMRIACNAQDVHSSLRIQGQAYAHIETYCEFIVWWRCDVVMVWVCHRACVRQPADENERLPRWARLSCLLLFIRRDIKICHCNQYFILARARARAQTYFIVAI